MTYIPEEIYLRGVTGPIQPQIDSLSAVYYSLSGDVYSLSGTVIDLSTDVYNLSSTVIISTNNIILLSSDVYSLSGTVSNLSSVDVITLSSDLYSLSSTVMLNTADILTLSSNLYSLSSTVGNLSSGGSGSSFSTFGITIDAGPAVISTGIKGYCIIPYNCTITKWYIVADKIGTIIIDVWKANNTIPTVANTITGTEKPTLSASQISSDINLTTWNTAVLSNDIVAFNVDSASSVSRITLTVEVEK